MSDHPMQPTPGQIDEWIAWRDSDNSIRKLKFLAEHVLARIARTAYAAGADAQLELCCKWTADRTTQWSDGTWPAEALRAAMRPKPPSLAEQALEELATLRRDAARTGLGFCASGIHRALERLAELEAAG